MKTNKKKHGTCTDRGSPVRVATKAKESLRGNLLCLSLDSCPLLGFQLASFRSAGVIFLSFIVSFMPMSLSGRRPALHFSASDPKSACGLPGSRGPVPHFISDSSLFSFFMQCHKHRAALRCVFWRRLFICSLVIAPLRWLHAQQKGRHQSVADDGKATGLHRCQTQLFCGGGARACESSSRERGCVSHARVNTSKWFYFPSFCRFGAELLSRLCQIEAGSRIFGHVVTQQQ